jgi:transcriptional regulator with XRE-family HTH domain
MQTEQNFGDQLRAWRQRRRMSQLDLASEAGISTRHLSFVETGRAAPSREMVLQLAEHLELPLREQNAFLVSAGFAPRFRERSLSDPELAAVRAAVDMVLKGHEPNPALAIDRRWTLLAANDAALKLMAGAVAAHLLAPPANVLRASLHPEGLAPRILNLGEWRAHIFARLERQIDATADAALIALLDELRA